MPRSCQQASAFPDQRLEAGAADAVAADTRRFIARGFPERSAADDERARLARELHDGLLQALAGISIRLSLVERAIASDPQAAIAQLREAAAQLTSEQRQLRAWVEDACAAGPSVVASGNELGEALDSLCHHAETRWALTVRLNAGPARPLPRTLGDHVYRIVQEALTNAGRHARAAHVEVRVRCGYDAVAVVVKDDGVGFPLRGTFDRHELERRGFGPRSLLARVAALDGALTLTSSPSGATLDIRLPVPDPVAGSRPGDRSTA